MTTMTMTMVMMRMTTRTTTMTCVAAGGGKGERPAGWAELVNHRPGEGSGGRAGGVASGEGQTEDELGGGLSDRGVRAMAVVQGRLYVGGAFSQMLGSQVCISTPWAVWGMGFRVEGFGLRVSGLSFGLRVWGSECGVYWCLFVILNPEP